MPGLIDLFFDIIGSTAWLIIIFGVISGFLHDVTLRRLTKASFNLNGMSIIDLSLAYFIGMMSFLFIYFYCYNHQETLPCSDSPASVAIFGLMLLYSGRIITKQQGVFFGKLHFSTIFISGAILLIFDTILRCKLNFSDFGSNFGISTMAKLLNQTCIISEDYLKMLYVSGDSGVDSLFLISFLGSLVLAIMGEAYLASTGPSSKSLLAVAEKFPSDFTVITGIYGKNDNIEKLLKDIFENDIIIKIKCVSKSLVFIDLIGKHIIDQVITNSEKLKQQNIEFDYQILKSPRERALEDRKNALLNLPFSLTNSLKNREGLFKEFEYEYNVREAYLNELERKNYVKVNECYFGDMIFILTENSSGLRKLLFLVKDKGNINNRVGLYTEAPYVINIFYIIFENAWNDQLQKTKPISDCLAEYQQPNLSDHGSN